MAIKSSKKTRSPKKQTNTRPSQRKGSKVKTVPREAKALLKKLDKENNGVKEMRKYPNGSIGVFFTNGKFRFVTGGTNLKPREKGSKVKYPRISKLGAKRALLKYYNNKSYKSPANRKSALTRDICSNNKPINKTSLYRRSPHLYDYPGVDDGSQCPKGHKVYNKKKITRSVKKTLLKRLKGKTALRKKGTKKSPKLSPRRKSKVTRKKNQKGGVLNDNDISQIMEEYQNKLDGVDMQEGGELYENDAGVGMFVDHTMEGGDMESMDMEHEMDASHGMEAGHEMEGGDMESMDIDHEMEGGDMESMDMDHEMEGGDMESMDMDHEMDASHGMEAGHEMEGGDLDTMDMEHEMDANHGMEAGHEMEAGHGMEGGDLSHMGINSQDEKKMNGGSSLLGVTGEMQNNGSELSMDSDDASSSDEEGQLGGAQRSRVGPKNIRRAEQRAATEERAAERARLLKESKETVAVPVAEDPLWMGGQPESLLGPVGAAPASAHASASAPASAAAASSSHEEDDSSSSSSEEDLSEDENLEGGGSDLSLNDAVGLLREYYTEKYGY